MPITDEEWERMVEEATTDSETDNTKTTFWPSRQEVLGGLGLLVGAIAGAIGGPCVLVLSLIVAEWMYRIRFVLGDDYVVGFHSGGCGGGI